VRVDLARGPPVYLIYLTAFARDGEVFFRDDLYDRDDRLLRALATAPRTASTRSPDVARREVVAAPRTRRTRTVRL